MEIKIKNTKTNRMMMLLIFKDENEIELTFNKWEKLKDFLNDTEYQKLALYKDKGEPYKQGNGIAIILFEENIIDFVQALIKFTLSDFQIEEKKSASSNISIDNQIKFAQAQTTAKWGRWSLPVAKQHLKKQIRYQHISFASQSQKQVSSEDEKTSIKNIANFADCNESLIEELYRQMAESKKVFEDKDCEEYRFKRGLKNKSEQDKDLLIKLIKKHSIDFDGYFFKGELCKELNCSDNFFELAFEEARKR